jgi:hypothetical protein
MLSRSDYNKFKLDFIIKTFVHLEQFAQWLRKFFYLNYELNREYDTIYQDAFYVVFYELTTVGLEYSKKVLNHLEKGDEKIVWYMNLAEGLENFKRLFTEIEFEYIKYKRHNASHIFQSAYEHKVFEKGDISSPKQENRIEQMAKNFQDLILKHGGDKNFDLYMNHKLYPLVIDLYNCLQNNSKTSG